MGDRFYQAQRNLNKGRKLGAQPRKLKKDVIAEINKTLDVELEGLEKMTIPHLEALLDAIKEKTRDLVGD